MNILNAIQTVHAVLKDAGAQIPTAIAAPLTIAAIPSALDTGLSVAASVATGDYIGAAAQGIPLLISGTMALYASLSQTRKPTNEQITTFVNGLSHDELIGLLSNNTGNTGSAANAAAVQPKPGMLPTATR